MLFSAAEESMLIGVLANWEPGLDWPGRVKHVPRLATAAGTLLEAGLIEVYEQYLGAGESHFLTEPEAIVVLSDPASWWHGEDGGAGANAEDDQADGSFYALVVTGRGADVMHTRGDDDLYGFLRH